MGTPRLPEPALLFIGTLYSNTAIFQKASKLLSDTFGEFLLASEPIQWDHSQYYDDELGKTILRQFIFFKSLIDPGQLADFKLKTNDIEQRFSANGKRQINLDPGYVTLSKIVLATTKNYAHRIYLGKGIYAEVTLIFKGNTFIPHLYTYRDYQDKQHIDIFLKARKSLKEKIMTDRLL
jgi:hypothetical protein